MKVLPASSVKLWAEIEAARARMASMYFMMLKLRLRMEFMRMKRGWILRLIIDRARSRVSSECE